MNKFYKYILLIYKYLLLILVISALVLAAEGCSSSVRFASVSILKPNILNPSNQTSEQTGEYKFTGRQFRGKASYYADKFHGRKTSSGELFDNNKMTAAHKTLPFGTIVKVTNLSNNKSVIVKINDRGPFVAGRIIDLSHAAAEAIGMIGAGVVEVLVQVVE